MTIAPASTLQNHLAISHFRKAIAMCALALALGFFLLPSNADDVAATQNPVDVGEHFSISDKYQPGDEFMDIRLLGAVRLRAKAVRGEKTPRALGLGLGPGRRTPHSNI